MARVTFSYQQDDGEWQEMMNVDATAVVPDEAELLPNDPNSSHVTDFVRVHAGEAESSDDIAHSSLADLIDRIVDILNHDHRFCRIGNMIVSDRGDVDRDVILCDDFLRRDLHRDGAQGYAHHLLDGNEDEREPRPAAPPEPLRLQTPADPLIELRADGLPSLPNRLLVDHADPHTAARLRQEFRHPESHHRMAYQVEQIHLLWWVY